ncbi:hypothetical protein D9758_016858 [Tetrapyrgos nigripes]|uniref:NACHT domain-containing protein n=1 Tax=Tetrapyrgos nigripes TaxID=182062 RepID=A0A8H5CE59_9AGAR|nr:hypothetical protein D9758_016858 [Tetrapyrgos nigripes]
MEMGRVKGLREAELKKMKVWVRTKTFRTINSIKTELGNPEGHEAQKVPVYFGVHEDENDPQQGNNTIGHHIRNQSRNNSASQRQIQENSNTREQTIVSQSMFTNASNFTIPGVAIGNVGRDFIHTTNNNFGANEKAEILKELKQKLNPIAKPARKTDTCLEGTRVKILNDLCNWAIEANTTIAWIYGIAGTGKSAIAVSLAHKIRKMDTKKEVKLALTFHCVKGQETSDICNLVPTLSYHFAQVFPEYGKGLLESLNEDPSLDSTSLSLSEQLELFLNPPVLEKLIIKSSEKLVIIIIDGLDEWGTGSNHTELLRHLKTLNQFAWLKIIVTSRPNPEITKELMGGLFIKKIDLTDHIGTADDLRKLITTKLPWVLNEKMDNMLAKANGLFIWSQPLQSWGAEKQPKLGAKKGKKSKFLMKFMKSSTISKVIDAISQKKSSQDKVTVPNLSQIGQNDTVEQPRLNVVEGFTKHIQNAIKIGRHRWINLPMTISATSAVESVAYSLDGRYIVSGSGDNTVRIWDVQTGHQFGESFIGHTECVWSVAYSPDGRHVVSGSDDYTLRTWDIQTGQQVGESLEGHRDGVHSVAFSPDGRHVVSGSEDNTVRIWDVQTGQQFGEPMKGHTKRVWSVAYSLDGRHVVSGSADYTIRIWDIQTGQQVGKPLDGHTVAFSPDGRHVVSGYYNTIRIWDMQTRQQVGELLEGYTGWVSSVAFSPDGRHVVSGSNDYTIRIWDMQTCQQVGKPLEGHTDRVKSVAFSPDGRHVVSGSDDCTIRIWDIQTFQQFEEPQQLSNHTDAIRSVAFSPDGRHVVSGSDDCTIRIWDMQTWQQVGKPLKGHIDWVQSVAFSPDGRHVVSGSEDRTIRIWDMQTCQQVGKPLEGHTDCVRSVAFSPDGRHVVSGSGDKTIRIWDMQTCKQVGKPLEGHTDWVLSVAFSPDGRHVVSGSSDCTIRIWDMQTSQQVGKPQEGHTDEVHSVAFSPDGRHVVSGFSDKTIRIWDMQTCQQFGEPLEGHTNWVESVAFSPDGRYVVSGSFDKTIRIWDMQTCQQIGEPLEGHAGWVQSVAFSPDGRHVVSGSWDKTVRIWNIDPSNPNLIPTSISQYNQENQSCSINAQGWLCTAEPEPKLILWIPSHLRGGFSDLRQVGTIPADAKNFGVKVDWSKFVCGENWTSVWNDNPEDEE